MSKSKIIVLALFASLALNLLFVGGIVSRVATVREFGPRPIPPNISWIVRDLPESRQTELAPLMEQNRSDANAVRRQMFEAQRRVNKLMEKQDYSSIELEQAFAQLRSVGLQYQELSHQQMLEILGKLTPEERLTARKFMQRRGPRDGFQGREGRPPRPSFDDAQRRPRPPQN